MTMPIEELRNAVHSKLIKISINALLKLRIRMLFSNRDGLVNYSLELFREMARRNYKGMLIRMVMRKLRLLSVGEYLKIRDFRIR